MLDSISDKILNDQDYWKSKNPFLQINNANLKINETTPRIENNDDNISNVKTTNHQKKNSLAKDDYYASSKNRYL